MENFQEKRKSVRVEGSLELCINFNPEIPDKFYCSSQDISEGGMRIRTPKPLKQGKYAILTFGLPNYPAEVVTQVSVAWASLDPKEDGYYESGIKFLVINDSEIEAIRSYVEEHADRF